jgi:hypothetical protein
MKMARVN